MAIGTYEALTDEGDLDWIGELESSVFEYFAFNSFNFNTLLNQTEWMLSAWNLPSWHDKAASAALLRTNPRITQPITNPEVFPSTAGQ